MSTPKLTNSQRWCHIYVANLSTSWFRVKYPWSCKYLIISLGIKISYRRPKITLISIRIYLPLPTFHAKYLSMIGKAKNRALQWFDTFLVFLLSLLIQSMSDLREMYFFNMIIFHGLSLLMWFNRLYMPMLIWNNGYG